MPTPLREQMKQSRNGEMAAAGVTPEAGAVQRTSVLMASPDQVSADLSSDQSETVVILGLRDGVYFELDQVGARTWQLIQEPRSMKSLVATLVEEYDVGFEECERDLLRFAAELVDRGLAVVVDATNP